MKGMMSFLERAGLIKQEESAAAAMEGGDLPFPVIDSIAPPSEAAIDVRAGGSQLNISDIYKNEGVAPSVYPAERLLRLLDGLSAMDEPIRRTAIAAMDAADESWSIDDPVADATAKVRALTTHSQRLTSSLQQLESETHARIDGVKEKTNQTVGAIRQQIADLEALAAREQERSAKETAEFEETLNTAKLQTTLELEEVRKISAQLQNLASQFGTSSLGTSNAPQQG